MGQTLTRVFVALAVVAMIAIPGWQIFSAPQFGWLFKLGFVLFAAWIVYVAYDSMKVGGSRLRAASRSLRRAWLGRGIGERIWRKADWLEFLPASDSISTSEGQILRIGRGGFEVRAVSRAFVEIPFGTWLVGQINWRTGAAGAVVAYGAWAFVDSTWMFVGAAFVVGIAVLLFIEAMRGPIYEVAVGEETLLIWHADTARLRAFANMVMNAR